MKNTAHWMNAAFISNILRIGFWILTGIKNDAEIYEVAGNFSVSLVEKKIAVTRGCEKEGWMNGCMDVWMDKWMYGGIKGGRMDGKDE